MQIKIQPNEKGNPPGKLADAELYFDASDGVLAGLKLIAFGVWERRDGGRNVTFPARQYSVNGERRSFALLRSADGTTAGQDRIRDLILDSYAVEMGEGAPVETPHGWSSTETPDPPAPATGPTSEPTPAPVPVPLDLDF